MASRALLAAGLLMASFALSSVSAAPPMLGTSAAAGADTLTPRAKAILETLQTTGDFDAATRAAEALFDEAMLTARLNAAAPLKEAAFTRRLLRQLQPLESAKRIETLTFLRKSPNLANALVFLMRPEDKPAEVFAVLDQLRARHEAKLEEFANLTAALCVVHDQPLVQRINENKAAAIDVAELFDFYVANDKKMFWGMKAVPAELQIYIVDNTANRAEMEWALDRYAKNKNVGALFHEIKYDHDHLKGAPKKSTVAGWGLQNILKHGGVCADQAYYAMTVGKAIGVPTTYTTARSGEVGHAWVGFLEDRGGGRGGWNFDNGRFGAYASIKGNVDDPQTRTKTPDSYISVLNEMLSTKTADRHTAVALVDAAHRMMETENPPAAPADVKPLRAAKPETAEEFIDAAIRLAPGNRDAWFVIRDLAKGDKLAYARKRAWSDRLFQVAGAKYPDFTVAVVKPMIESIKETREQSMLWDKTFQLFSRRLDLAAEIKVAQGEMWLAANDITKAGMCYEEVLKKFANAGPFVLAALQRTEELLVKANKPDRVVDLYAQTWGRTERPKEMAPEFATQSNWFRVGKVYVAKLDAAGQKDKASKIREEIESTIGVRLAAGN